MLSLQTHLPRRPFATIADPLPDFTTEYKFDGNDSAFTEVGTPSYEWGKAKPESIGALLNGIDSGFQANGDSAIFAEAQSGGVAGELSISVWIKVTGYEDSYGEIISTQSDTVAGSFKFRIKRSDETAQIVLGGSPAQYLSIDAKYIQKNTWTHIVLTFVGTSFKYYVDGVYRDGQTITAHTFADTGLLGICKAGNGTYAYYTGMVDNLRVWNYDIGASGANSMFLYQSQIISGYYSINDSELGATLFNRASTAYDPETNLQVLDDKRRRRPLTINNKIVYADLCENAGTNHCAESEDFTAWTLSNGGTGLVPNVTSGFTGPSDDLPAHRFQGDLDGGTTADDYSRITLNADTTAFTSGGSLSLWVKSNDANDYDIQLNFSGGGGGLITVTPVWQRLSTINVPTSSNNIRIGIRQGTYRTSDTCDILIAGCQLEDSDYMTSYIKTSGAITTRLVDDFTATINKALSLKGSFFTSVIPYNGTMLQRVSPRAYSVDGTVKAQLSNLDITRDDVIDDNEVSLLTAQKDSLFTFASVWDGTIQKHKAYLDGVYVGEADTETTFITLLNEILQFGNRDALDRGIDGWVHILAKNSAMTETEVLNMKNTVGIPVTHDGEFVTHDGQYVTYGSN